MCYWRNKKAISIFFDEKSTLSVAMNYIETSTFYGLAGCPITVIKMNYPLLIRKFNKVPSWRFLDPRPW